MSETVRIAFIEADGNRLEIEAKVGDSVMQAAKNNDIYAILGDCGGALSCATCHVHVTTEWRDRVGVPEDSERMMLEMAIDPDESSRLSCQIKITKALDGLILRLPRSQL